MAPDAAAATDPPPRAPPPAMPPAPRLRRGDSDGDGKPTATQPPRRRRSLSRQAIVDAALKIVDAEGLDAMTMRRVGQELETGGASLYAHVANKDELLELVIDRVIGELEIPGEPDRERWQEQLKQAVRSMRSTLAAHKDIARGCLARIPLGPNALRGSEAMIGVMRAGSLPDQVIAYACDLLPLYATAVAYEESLYAVAVPSPAEIERFVADLRDYFAALPPAVYPNIVALAGPLTAGSGGDERFEFGLDVLVRGLASVAADARPAAGQPPPTATGA
ncbi:MAG: TetR/AcrR family transcriptional regulator [Solirubrobacteraceae bacterium]